MKRKSIALLTSLAVLATMVLALSPAQATAPGHDEYACQFQGGTTVLTGVDNTTNPDTDTGGISSIQHDLTHSPTEDPFHGRTTNGTYSFSGSGICSQVDADARAGTEGGTTGDDSGVFGVNISSTDGTYNNIICGTGEATGSATVTLASPQPANLPQPSTAGGEGTVTATYTITFVAGRGALQITGGTDGDGDSPIKGAGVVSLRARTADPPPETAPDDPQGCLTKKATGFSVNGAFTAVAPGV